MEITTAKRLRCLRRPGSPTLSTRARGSVAQPRSARCSPQGRLVKQNSLANHAADVGRIEREAGHEVALAAEVAWGEADAGRGMMMSGMPMARVPPVALRSRVMRDRSMGINVRLDRSALIHARRRQRDGHINRGLQIRQINGRWLWRGWQLDLVGLGCRSSLMNRDIDLRPVRVLHASQGDGGADHGNCQQHPHPEYPGRGAVGKDLVLFSAVLWMLRVVMGHGAQSENGCSGGAPVLAKA